MIEVGSYEAKTKLAELLRLVETKGEEICITRKGKRIAKIVPLIPQILSNDIISEIKHFRTRVKLNKSEIEDMITEGRK